MGLGRVACGSASHIEGGGPSRYVIALGYAGWGQGPLEEELTRHGWFVAPVSDQLLFGTSAQDRWSAAWSANGIARRLLASQNGHACKSGLRPCLFGSWPGRDLHIAPPVLCPSSIGKA